MLLQSKLVSEEITFGATACSTAIEWTRLHQLTLRRMAEWMRRTCHQIASSKTTDEDTSSADDVQRDADTAQEDAQWDGTTAENISSDIIVKWRPGKSHVR